MANPKKIRGGAAGAEDPGIDDADAPPADPAPKAPAADAASQAPIPTREERIAKLALERQKASMGALSREDSLLVATAQIDHDDALAAG